MAAKKMEKNPVSVSLAPSKRGGKETPDIELRTGLTGGKKYMVKINQPKGRAILIALHL
jgi:hypothetical protein